MGRPVSAKPEISEEFIPGMRPGMTLQDDIEAAENEVAAEFDADPNKADWTVQVWKYGADGKRTSSEFCLTIPASEIEGIKDRVRDEWGAGSYMSRVYCNKKLKRQIPWSIAKGVERANVSPVSQSVSETATIARALENQGKMIERLVMRIEERQQQPQIMAPQPQQDPMQMFQTFAGLMTSLREFIQPAGAQSGIELVMKGIELARELGDGTREKGIIEILGDVLTKTPLLENITAAQGTMPSLPHPQPQPGKPGGIPPQGPRIMPNGQSFVVPNGGQPQPQPNPTQDQFAEIRGMLHHLTTRAAKGSSPGLYADVILDSIENPIIMAQVQQPGAFELLAQIHPPITNFEPWFRRLLALVNDPNADDTGEPQPNAVFGPQHPAYATHGHSGWSGGGEGDVAEDGGID